MRSPFSEGPHGPLASRRSLGAALSLVVPLLAASLLARPLAAQPNTAKRVDQDFSRVVGGDAARTDAGLVVARRGWEAIRVRLMPELSRQDRGVQEGGRQAEQLLSYYLRQANFQQKAIDYYLAGRMCGLTGQLELARQNFEKALARDRYFYWAHHGLGAYYARRQLHEPAVLHFQKALGMDPSHLESARGLAFSLFALQQYGRGIPLVEQILQVTPTDGDLWRALGGALALSSEYGKAAQAFEKVCSLNRRDAEARHMQVRCLWKGGRQDEAVRVMERHLLDDPSDWRGHMRLATYLLERGDNHLAADTFQRGLKVLPSDAKGPDGKPLDKARLAQHIAELRSRPAHTVRDPRAKSRDDWNNILVESVDERLRRRAAAVLLAVPDYDPSTTRAFIRAVLQRDPVVRTRALQYFDRWLEKEALAFLVPMIEKLLVAEKDPRVIGYAAAIIGQSRHARAVPILMEHLDTRDPYAFQQVHEALNANTFAYIDASRVKAYETRGEMDAVARQWRAWYAKNRDRYRGLEDPKSR